GAELGGGRTFEKLGARGLTDAASVGTDTTGAELRASSGTAVFGLMLLSGLNSIGGAALSTGGAGLDGGGIGLAGGGGANLVGGGGAGLGGGGGAGLGGATLAVSTTLGLAAAFPLPLVGWLVKAGTRGLAGGSGVLVARGFAS